MDANFIKNHLVLTSAQEIEQICSPLKILGITYFSFVRSFKDGSHIRLSNHAQWTEHYYTRGFYNVILKQVPNKDSNVLWSCIDRYPLFQEASEFNIDNGTVIVLSGENVVERYFFGSTRDNHQVNHIYIYKQDLLNKFILYFKEQAHHLIKSSLKRKIILPKQKDSDTAFYNDVLINDFLDKIKVKKVYVNVSGVDLEISKKEAQILSFMKLGYSAKEIAKEVKLSVNTIDIYRGGIREKLGIRNSIDLFKNINQKSLLSADLFID